MSNFLQLVQNTFRLVRIGQADIGTEPADVENQTGKQAEFVFFVQMAWNDIQNEKTGWRFMRKNGTLTLAQGQTVVLTSAIPDFDMLATATDDRGRFITLYSDDVRDEQIVRYVPWQHWQQSYLQRGPRGVGTPANFTVRPDNSLEFDLEADRPYTINVWYKRTPQTLLVSSDTPIMPARYSMAIVWWAINRYYCLTRSDAKMLEAKSAQNLRLEMMKLYNSQLDEFTCIEVSP